MKAKSLPADDIIGPRDKTVMRAYRFTTVEIQMLKRIADKKKVGNTHVLSSLIKWYWNEHMPGEPMPQPIPPEQLKSSKPTKRGRGKR